MNGTERTQTIAHVAIPVIVVVCLVGWAALDRDPSNVYPMLYAMIGLAATGHASAAAKRATFKKEAAE